MTEVMDDLCSALKNVIEAADEERALELAAAITGLWFVGFRFDNAAKPARAAAPLPDGEGQAAMTMMMRLRRLPLIVWKP
jgi:hypothetical protein